jgi:predicted PurR-regulated permease PerM
VDKRITIDFSVKTVFVVVASLAAIWLAYYLRDVLVLFLVSFILATAFEPAVNLMERRRVPRWLSILALYAVVIGIVFALVRLIVPPISAQVNQLVANRLEYVAKINSYIEMAPESFRASIHNFTNAIPERVTSYSSTRIFDNVFGIFSGVFGAITVFVIVFYLLSQKNTLENMLLSYWPDKSRNRALDIFKQVVEKVSFWARGQLILSGSIFLLTFIGLTVLKVPYALTLALIAGVTEMLPVVGPFIGAAPAVLLAFTISPWLALWTGVLYLGIQQFENHILVPQVMKRAVGLSPVAIIFSLLVGAKLLGIIGVILAVPVAAGIMVVVDSFANKKK